jgi:hypothetical protein
LERRLAEPERLRVKDRLAYWLAELPDLSGEAPRLVAERRGRLIRIFRQALPYNALRPRGRHLAAQQEDCF